MCSGAIVSAELVHVAATFAVEPELRRRQRVVLVSSHQLVVEAPETWALEEERIWNARRAKIQHME